MYFYLKTQDKQYLDYIVYPLGTDLDIILNIKQEMNKIEI